MLRDIKTIETNSFGQKVLLLFFVVVFFSFEVQLLLVLSFCQNRQAISYIPYLISIYKYSHFL